MRDNKIQKKIRPQVCMSDPTAEWRDKVQSIREAWLKHNPHEMTEAQLYGILTTAPISDVIRLLIDKEVKLLKDGKYISL